MALLQKGDAVRIDQEGILRDPRVRVARSANIERGSMHQVRGIIVHQTDSDAATATLNSYRNAGAAGAHFLIDRDGTMVPSTKRRGTSAG
jgi:N-acetyl-anhydromuramyl-L-alanine amidase AmpD